MTEADPVTAPTGSGTAEDDRPKTPNTVPEVGRDPPDNPGDERGVPAYRGPQQIHAGMRS
jgi:hypothetical protein